MAETVSLSIEKVQLVPSPSAAATDDASKDKVAVTLGLWAEASNFSFDMALLPQEFVVRLDRTNASALPGGDGYEWPAGSLLYIQCTWSEWRLS